MDGGASVLSADALAGISAYLADHPEIVDVIVSGGDPLTLPTAALARVLAALRRVPSVEIVRVGTRIPAVLPQRVTPRLLDALRRAHPLWVNTHFNHPRELPADAAAACARFADAGIPLNNQAVLLRGVNDDPTVLERLCRGLLRIRVRPYYLFQCDLVSGVGHFRVPLRRGLEIMEALRPRLGGLALPRFVADLAEADAKIPLTVSHVVSMDGPRAVLRDGNGRLIEYPEPSGYE